MCFNSFGLFLWRYVNKQRTIVKFQTEIKRLFGEINGDVFVIVNFYDRTPACRNAEGDHMLDIISEILVNVNKINLI